MRVYFQVGWVGGTLPRKTSSCFSTRFGDGRSLSEFPRPLLALRSLAEASWGPLADVAVPSTTSSTISISRLCMTCEVGSECDECAMYMTRQVNSESKCLGEIMTSISQPTVGSEWVVQFMLCCSCAVHRSVNKKCQADVRS